MSRKRSAETVPTADVGHGIIADLPVYRLTGIFKKSAKTREKEGYSADYDGNESS